MFKGEDVVLLLKLSASPDWTVRTLAEETGIPRSVVHRALKRLAAAGLLDERRRRRVNVSQAEEFLIHAVKYVFPAAWEGESRGVPTPGAPGALGRSAGADSEATGPVLDRRGSYNDRASFPVGEMRTRSQQPR
jgi:DNA-binding transcriptional MocR family regulator